MAVNSIFHTNNKSSILAERNLYKDLIKEAIQIYGHDVYYVDRTLVSRDNVLGEDALSKFTSANLLSSTTSISTSYTNILSLAITPASSSNKICVFSSCQAYIANTGGNLYALPQATRLLRREIGGSSTSLVEDSVLSQRDNYNGTKYQEGVSSLAFQDSPSTTSEITYYLDYKRNSNANSGNVGQAMMLIFEVGV